MAALLPRARRKSLMPSASSPLKSHGVEIQTESSMRKTCRKLWLFAGTNLPASQGRRRMPSLKRTLSGGIVTSRPIMPKASEFVSRVCGSRSMTIRARACPICSAPANPLAGGTGEWLPTPPARNTAMPPVACSTALSQRANQAVADELGRRETAMAELRRLEIAYGVAHRRHNAIGKPNPHLRLKTTGKGFLHHALSPGAQARMRVSRTQVNLRSEEHTSEL